jgi:hypothetical protein
MHNLEKEVAENFYTILKSCPHKWAGYPLFALFHVIYVLKSHFFFFIKLHGVCGNVDKLSTAIVDNSNKEKRGVEDSTYI